jgi:predicted nucleic acid-binding protein
MDFRAAQHCYAAIPAAENNAAGKTYLSCSGDIVLLEILQGAQNDRHAANLQKRLAEFAVVPMLTPEIAMKAAGNFRRLREKGTTIRKTADLIIGTFCIEHDYSLLHADRNFDPMAEHLGLRVA